MTIVMAKDLSLPFSIIRSAISFIRMEEKYFAFVSYQRNDEEWAMWVAHQLEHYHLPASLNGRDDLPKSLRPVFRDIDELAAGNLPEQLRNALFNSRNLIVICSPHSAQSKWVNQEIATFIEFGRVDRIFPFIVDGEAFSKEAEKECFPPALRELPQEQERLGGNVHEFSTNGDVTDKGRDAAIVKVIAGMLHLGFDTLWQRYEREKVEEEQRMKRERDKLLSIQSRMVSEKVMRLCEDGDNLKARRLVLEVMPKDPGNPDRPYVAAAEHALRMSLSRDSAILRTDSSQIASVALSPDGKLIASLNDTLQIWETNSGKPLTSFYVGTGKSVVFSRDGRYILASGQRKVICVDTSRMEICKCFDTHRDFGYSVAISLDSSLVAVGLGDGTAFLFDMSQGQAVREWRVSSDIVRSIAFSPDGKMLASGSGDSVVRIWDLETGELSRVMEGHEGQVTTVCFSLDGGLLASASTDIILWNGHTGQLVKTLKGHETIVSNLVFHPDGKTLISSSWDHTIRIWNIESGFEMRTFSYEDEINAVDISDDGLHIVSGLRNGLVKVEDIRNDKSHMILRQDIDFNAYGPIAFSPTRKFMVSSGGNLQLQIWNSLTGCLLGEMEGHTAYVNSLAFSHDEKLVASGSGDRTVRIWDVGKLCVSRVLEGHTDTVLSVAFNPKGTIVASGSMDGTIRLWEVSSGSLLRVLKGCQGESFYSMAFNPEGGVLAAGAATGTLFLFDVTTGQCIKKGPGHADRVCYIQYSHDGEKIVSASDDGLVLIRESSSLEVLFNWADSGKHVSVISISEDGSRMVLGGEEGWIGLMDLSSGVVTAQFNILFHDTKYNELEDIAFVTGGKEILAVGQRTFFRLDIESSRIIQYYTGMKGSGDLLRISPDGRFLLIANPPQTFLQIWSMESHTLESVLYGHEDTINDAVFTSDSKSIITCSDDKTLRRWDIKSCRETGRSHEFTGRAERLYKLGDSGTVVCFDYENGLVCKWDSESGKEELFSFNPGKIGSACLSASGKFIALMAKDGHCVEIDDCGLAKETCFIENAACDMLFSFSPDERYLVASSDGSLVLWDTLTGKAARRFDDESGWPTAAAMSQDGQRLLSILNDGRVVLWDVGTNEIIQTFDFGKDRIKAACFHKDTILLLGERIHLIQYPPLERLVTGLRKEFKDYPLSEKERKDYYLD